MKLTMHWRLTALAAAAAATAGVRAQAQNDGDVCGPIYDELPLPPVRRLPEDGRDTCFGDTGVLWLAASEHKTGTLFAGDLLEKVSAYCNKVGEEAGDPWRIDTHHRAKEFREDEWLDHPERPVFSANKGFFGQLGVWNKTESRHERLRVTHFIRDPMEMVLSAYNYHKTSPEGWTRIPWPPSERPPGLLAEPHYANVSYGEALAILPEREGVLLEASREIKPILAMVRGFCTSKHDVHYMPTSYKDYAGTEGIANGCRLFRFLGMRRRHASVLAVSVFGEQQGITKPEAPLSGAAAAGEQWHLKHVTKGTYDKEAQMGYLRESPLYPVLLRVVETMRSGDCSGNCSRRNYCHENLANAGVINWGPIYCQRFAADDPSK